MDIVFGTKWFDKHQSKLLFLLNNKFTKRWFRWCLRIRQYDCPLSSTINRIEPSCFSFGARLLDEETIEVKTDFRTHDKYAKRLYYAFKPVWYTMHFFDWLLFDRFSALEKLNFGFLTLTVYPDASGGSTTMSEANGRGSVTENWATIRAGAGTFAFDFFSSMDAAGFTFAGSAGNVSELQRSIYTYDTSPLTSGASISATVLSLYGVAKNDGGTPVAPDIDIYTATPASDSTPTNSDYGQIGTTSQTGSPIAYSSWSTSGYNDFTLNSTGRGNVSKTGISKFGARNANYDVSGTTPTWSNGSQHRFQCSGSDQSGTSQDPKLVVTYTVSVASANFLLFMPM